MDVFRSNYCRLRSNPRSSSFNSTLQKTESISSRLTWSTHSREKLMSPHTSRLKRVHASEDPDRNLYLNRTLAESLIYAGSCGSLAVVFGNYLDINPFGNIHWSNFDFFIGLEFALPPVLLSYMIFKFGENQNSMSRIMLKKTEDKKFNLLTNSSRKYRTPVLTCYFFWTHRETGDLWKDLKAALNVIRSTKVGQYSILRRPLQLLLMESFLFWFPAEMLSGVIGLTATGNWFRDRFSEAGLDGYLLANGLDPATMGKWTSLACFIVISIGIVLYRAQSTRKERRADYVQRVQTVLEKNVNSSIPTKALEKLMSKMDAQSEIIAAVQSVIEIIQRICLSSAFVVTGNLGSSLVVAGAPFLLETWWKENGYMKQLAERAKMREQLETIAIQAIKAPIYEKLKQRFLKEINKAEKDPPNSTEEIEDDESSSQDEAKEEDVEEEDEGVMKLNLAFLTFFFNMILADLNRVVDKGRLSDDDFDQISEAKVEIEALVNRSKKLMKDNKDMMSQKPALNFFRSMKDRYKGINKDE
eukprot:g205.t1